MLAIKAMELKKVKQKHWKSLILYLLTILSED